MIFPRVLLACLCLLPGCKPPESPVARGNRTQTLELGNLTEPADLDPQVINSQSDFNIVFTLLEGLTTPDAKDLHPTPGAAQSWDISADGTVYTFHLRRNARWTDGTPVTADDFLFSYRRMLSPKLASEYSYMLYVVRNAEDYNKGKITDFNTVGFKALDPFTLQVTLNAPTPYFLSLIGHHSWFPVPRQAIEKAAAAARVGTDERGTRWTRPENYVGNGPFVLKEWKTNQVISVEKSPTYWDADKILLHGMNFYPIESVDTEERAFRGGQLHITYTFPPSKLDTYRHEHPDLLHIDPMLGVYFYRLVVTKPALSDVRVRRALSMSIDREQITSDITRCGQMPAYNLVPPGTAGYQPVQKIVEDVPAAQKLLTEAGYPDGKNFPPMQILFNTNETHRAIAEGIQAMWQKNLHINASLQNQEQKVLQNTMRELDYQIGRYAWFGDYVDPNTFMSLMISAGGNNETGWSNPEYDRLVNLAAKTGDAATRTKIFQQAEGILIDEAPIVPLYFYTRVNLRRPEVHGWYSNLLDIHNAKGIYLKANPGR